VCFISLTAFGEKLQEQQNLQSIWKELEKLKEIDFLKERTRALELQNHYLNQKVETLERQCAEHSVEVIILAYQNHIS
jgi:predicted Rossmann fold nucleotide-binding protein DprA/Smf involved in DNA uptake